MKTQQMNEDDREFLRFIGYDPGKFVKIDVQSILTSDVEPTLTHSSKPIPDEEIPFCDMDCTYCVEYEQEYEEEYEEEPMMWGVPDINRIVFSPPATIVFWDDGTKTVVKAMEGENYEKYAGFAMACMKKMFGSTCRAKKIMEECDLENLRPPRAPESKLVVEQPKKSETKTKQNISLNDLLIELLNGIKTITAASKENKDATPAE